MIGLQEGHDKLSRYIIKSGCDVNIIDHLGQSALYFAVHRSTSPSLTLCQKLFKYEYDAENDSEWLSKDLYQKLTQTGKGLLSRLLRILGLTKVKVDFDCVEDFLSDDYVDVRMSRML